MKVSKEKVQEIAEKMRVVMDHFKWSKEKLSPPTNILLWQFWNYIFQETAYDDSHPKFKGRKRLFNYDPNYSLYPEETNDDTMFTALKAAWKLV